MEHTTTLSRLSTRPMRPNHLKTRIILLTALLVLLIATPIELLIEAYYARYLKRAMANQQLSFVSQIAVRMNEDITHAQASLAAEAARLSPSTLNDPAAARRFLADRGSLATVFDYGLFLFSDTGKLLADSSAYPTPPGADYAQASYIKKTLKRRAPVVSMPYLSAHANFHPVVMFTVPVRDAQGNIRAIFAGGMDLLKQNILARPAGIAIGKTGYLAVYTPTGIVVTHTDRAQILASFSQSHFASLAAETEPSIETNDFRDVPTLMTRRTIAATGWTIASSYPTAELYAPLAEARRMAYGIIAIGVFLTVVITSVLARYLTRSLANLTAQVATITTTLDPDQRVDLDQHDETGQLALAINQMLAALGDSQHELARLVTELSEVEERERHRIASDLHDSICQSLAAANMQLGALYKILTHEYLPAAESETARSQLETVRTILSTSVADMRTLVFDLSPPILYELGLKPAIEWSSEGFAESKKIRVRVTGDAPPEVLGQTREMFLFRAVREVMLNASKHANADTLDITLTHQRENETVSHMFKIVIADNGDGFVPRTRRPSTDAAGGFGLFSLQERLRFFGGYCQVDSTPGAGTTVTLAMPIAAAGGGTPSPPRTATK